LNNFQRISINPKTKLN